MKSLKLQGLVKTKSNYRNLNNKFVNIHQFIGTLVYCSVYCNEKETEVFFDLNLNEIYYIKSL